MHELSYEPPSEGLADGRRLARWLAAGTLVVFGLLGASSLVQVVQLTYGVGAVVAWSTEAQIVLGYLISGLAAPMAVAAFAAWMATGRVAGVVVALLAIVPLTAAAAGIYHAVWFMTDYGVDWSLVGWLPFPLGYLLLGLLFLTPTFRRAANATPPARG